MGQTSSQQEGATPQRNPNRIGPSMSPTPDTEECEKTNKGPNHQPASLPTAEAAELNPDGHLGNKKKKKHKKRRKSLESDASLEAGPAAQDHVDEPDLTKKRRKKRQRRTGPEPDPEIDVEEHGDAAFEPRFQVISPAVNRHKPVEPRFEVIQEPQPSPKQKRKRLKKHAIIRQGGSPAQEGLPKGDNIQGDREAAIENGIQSEDTAHDRLPALRPRGLDYFSPARTKGEERQEAPASEAQHQHLHAPNDGSSPPSAQPPRLTDILNYEPLSDEDEYNTVNPPVDWEPRRRESTKSLDVSQIKRERPDSVVATDESQLGEEDAAVPPIRLGSNIKRDPFGSDEDTEELLRYQFAGIAAANVADSVTDPVAVPDDGLGWLHKKELETREPPITDTRTLHQRLSDAGLPERHPGQIKTGAGANSDINSDSSTDSELPSMINPPSPSAQRSQRLSRSKSRSISKAPSRSGSLADGALGPRPEPYNQVPYTNAQMPYSAPSSTGSNRSIPARLSSPLFPSSPRPRSSRSTRSSRAGRDAAPTDFNTVDKDSTVVQESSPPKQRRKKAPLAKNKPQPLSDKSDIVMDDAATSANVGTAADDPPSVQKSQRNQPRKKATPVRKKAAPPQHDDVGVADAGDLTIEDGDVAALDPRVVEESSLPKQRGKKAAPAKKKVIPSSQPDEFDAVDGDAVVGADAADIDAPVVQVSSPPKQRGKKAPNTRKNKTLLPQSDESGLVNGDVVVGAGAATVDTIEAPTNGDVVDDDESLAEKPPSQQAKRAKRAALSRKGKAAHLTQLGETDALTDPADVNAGTMAAKPKRPNRRRRSDNDVADSSVHVMENWLGSSVNGVQQSNVEDDRTHGFSDDELPLAFDDMPIAEEVQPETPEVPPKKPQRRKSKASLAQDLEPPLLLEGDTRTPEAVQSVTQPQRSSRREPKASLAQLDEPQLPAEDGATASVPAITNGEVAASQRKKGKKPATRASAVTGIIGPTVESADEGQDTNPEPAVTENAPTARDDSVDPQESVSQRSPSKTNPKGKRKRMLRQPKESLSLSQMMEEDGDEDFSAIFSRRISTKRPTTRRTTEQEPSQAEPSQALSPEKPPRKTKRKRRSANDPSEDEMESLLAAGPSKGRKKVKKVAESDEEDVRETKKKRLASAGSGQASGPWTTDELSALGRVVDDFRHEHAMTEEEINQLIHDVPNKGDPLNKDFWDAANEAIPRRSRQQITERARRIYHNFAGRGKWTDEQKEEVHELFESHPKKWAEIAGIINRDQKDVRDYWRNHYVVLDAQIKSRWTQEEENRLKEAVEEALNKIRIDRENNDEYRPRPRVKGQDDDAMLDWQQISAAMGLTRSRQQCKWKWTDLREKGLVGDDRISPPTQARSKAGSKIVISEELARARQEYQAMDHEDKFRLVEAILDSGAREEKLIQWRTLVDEQFRKRWHRPALRLAWYRLRQTVPDYQNQDVEDNARHLVNYYHQHQLMPPFRENAIDDQAEENVVDYKRGKKVWKKPSQDLRAIRERQRRSSSASSRARSRPNRKVSSEILNLHDSDDYQEAPRSSSRQSSELGEGRELRSRRDGLRSDDLEVSIPGHLQGEAADQALQKARTRGRRTDKGKGRVDGPSSSKRGPRSNSVAVDSESE